MTAHRHTSPARSLPVARLWPAPGGPSLWLRCFDICLIALLTLAPFAIGGRHPIGTLIYVALIAAAMSFWLVHQWCSGSPSWISSPLHIYMVAGVGLLVLQLIAWPGGFVSTLAPGGSAFLPGADGEANLGELTAWTQLSLTPTATRRGLILLLAYAALFFAVVQRLRDVGEIEWLLKWVALAAVAMATFGIVQYLTSNGRFLWFYAHPFRDTNDVVKGAFVNRNHFAHFLALGLPPLIWWIVGTKKSSRSPTDAGGFARRGPDNSFPMWLCLSLGVVVLASLLSLSRGGVGAMLLASVGCAVLLYRVDLLDKRLTGALLGLSLLVAVALAIHGAQGVFNRVAEVVSGSLDGLDHEGSRRQIWLADLRGIACFPLFGAGVGSHAAVYPMFFPGAADTTEYTHAESGYLHVALEAGLVGLALALLVIAAIARWCWQAWRLAESTRRRACLAAIFPGLLISALHSLVDFVWFIPACMATTVILAACAYRLWLLNDLKLSQRYSRAVRAVHFRWAAAVVALIGTWMVAESIGPALAAPAWDGYLRVSAAATKAELLTADEPNPDPVTRALERRRALEQMIEHLQATLRHDPQHCVAHVRLSAAHLQLFDLLQDESPSAMPLTAVRDAAFASRFDSREQLDAWLTRAVGPHDLHLKQACLHARQSLRLCPLMGEAYLYLKNVCFLEGSDAAAKGAYLAQALKVRPFDGEIHFEAGRESFLDGQPEAAIQHWRQAYHSSQQYKIRLIDLFAGNLASRVPVTVFLESFDPDLDGLRRLRLRYRDLKRPEDWQTLLKYSAQQLGEHAKTTSGAKACPWWLEAASLYRELADLPERTRCVEAALAADPNDYAAHQVAAICFHEAEQFTAAETHVNWCLSRAPNDKDLKRIRQEIVMARVKNVHRAASTPGNANALQ